MTSRRFVHSEAALAQSLNLNRKKISALRGTALHRGEDWSHEHGEVRYSDTGRERLLALLAVSPAPPAEAEPVAAGAAPAEHLAPKKSEEAAPAPTSPATTADIVLVRLYPLNRRIAQGRLESGALVRVRVRDNRNLTPAMTMPCRHLGADLWELTHALPRWKGKW